MECEELNPGPPGFKDYRRFEAGYSSMRIRYGGGENRKTYVSPLQKAKQPTAEQLDRCGRNGDEKQGHSEVQH